MPTFNDREGYSNYSVCYVYLWTRLNHEPASSMIYGVVLLPAITDIKVRELVRSLYVYNKTQTPLHEHHSNQDNKKIKELNIRKLIRSRNEKKLRKYIL